MNATRFLAVMPYGDAWRTRRRMFQHHFPPSDPSGIGISRSEEFVRKYLLPNILTSPGDFRKHIRNIVGGITLSLAYGLQIRRFNDPWINLAEMALHTTTEAAVVGRYFVDIIPVLKYVPGWLPGAGFQKVGKEGRRIVNNFFEQLYDAAVQEIVGPVFPLVMTNWSDCCAYDRRTVPLSRHWFPWRSRKLVRRKYKK